MAGDEHYACIMDDAGNTIDQKYIGKMRYYCSDFSLGAYKYHDDSNGKYNLLERLSCGKVINCYHLLTQD